MRWNRVARNVADAATPPAVGSTRRGHRTTWTAGQLGAFLDFIAEDRYLAPWILLATTGCRRGECLGLWWSDLDLDNATAIVSRQVTSIDHEIVVKDLRLFPTDSDGRTSVKRSARTAGSITCQSIDDSFSYT